MLVSHELAVSDLSPRVHTIDETLTRYPRCFPLGISGNPSTSNLCGCHISRVRIRHRGQSSTVPVWQTGRYFHGSLHTVTKVFGGWLWFVLNDFLTEIPAAITHSECKEPQNSYHILRFHGVDCVVFDLTADRTVGIRPFLPAAVPAAGVTVAQIDPKNTVITQSPAKLSEHRHQMGNIVGRSFFVAYLFRHVVVTKLVIRRRVMQQFTDFPASRGALQQHRQCVLCSIP